jgi:hypothetical protein
MLDLSLVLYGLSTQGVKVPNSVQMSQYASGFRSPESTGRERTWNNTPNFGSLPKDQKPVNGYQDTQYRGFQSLGFVVLVPHGVPVSFSPSLQFDNGALIGSISSLLNDNFQFDSHISSLVNQVTIKALVKMADAKVNVAVAYAEASKTSDLIFDTARRIDRAYRAFRKGDLRGIAQNLNITPRRLHKSWLEYKYGWMPLLMDVKGAAEFFAQQHVVRPPKFTVSASESFVNSKNYSISVPTYGGGSPHDIQVLLSAFGEVKVKIWCELSSPHLSAMQQLGLTNPALIAWELVPFSFVFDWFIQVGDWLTAMTAQQGVTITRKMYHTISAGGYAASEPGTSTSDASYSYHTGAKTWGGSKRVYARSIPDLSPFSLYPPMTNSFNFPKLVTSLALIQGTYRGSSRTARI